MIVIIIIIIIIINLMIIVEMCLVSVHRPTSVPI